MNRKAKKKLSLHGERIRNLDPQSLLAVGGGCSQAPVTTDIYDCRWHTFTQL